VFLSSAERVPTAATYQQELELLFFAFENPSFSFSLFLFLFLFFLKKGNIITMNFPLAARDFLHFLAQPCPSAPSTGSNPLVEDRGRSHRKFDGSKRPPSRSRTPRPRCIAFTFSRSWTFFLAGPAHRHTTNQQPTFAFINSLACSAGALTFHLTSPHARACTFSHFRFMPRGHPLLATCF